MTTTLTLTPEERFVQDWLAQMGVSAEKVAEDPRRKTCDFRGTATGAVYWIEVKTRDGDERLDIELARDGEAYRQEPLGYEAGTRRIIDHAVKQLASMDPAPSDFQVLFVVCTSPHEAAVSQAQIVGTVFGREKVLDTADLTHGWKECYFFAESAFYRHKGLDAVIPIDRIEGRYVLTVNSHSPRYESFKRSAVYQFFDAVRAKTGALAILDPLALEAEGRAYVADCDLPRTDRIGVLAYVAAKYHLTAPSALVLDEHSAFKTVPRER